MTWTQHMSKTWKRPYWYNSETGKSFWIKPDSEEEKTGIEKEMEKLKLKSEIEKPDSQITLDTKKREFKIENDDFQEYEITNGFITTTIRARDKYDAMEEMRSIAQSLNPYD
jgi:uncharacterized protein YgiM (DUF1202 family)